MQILGKIPGNKYVFTHEDYSNAAKPVASLPDPTTSTDNIIFLTRTTSGYVAGTLLKKTVNAFGKASWDILRPPTDGVGSCYNVRSFMTRNEDEEYGTVHIRWNDPEDLRDEHGELYKLWDRTVIVKKLGSDPENINDGTICMSNYIRNKYATDAFEDIVPIGEIGDLSWHYRLFAVAQDGAIDSPESSCMTPIEIDWNYMSNYIQAGWATKLFAPGDSIFVTGGTKPWNNIECTVAGFDQYDVAVPGKQRSMTLIFEVPAESGKNLPFDIPWGGYHFTQDEVADGATNYYTRTVVTSGTNPVATWKRTLLPQGFRITDFPQTYYDVVLNATNFSGGTNEWSMSEFRRWANWFNRSKDYDPSNSQLTSSFPRSETPRHLLESALEDAGVGLFLKSVVPVYVKTAKRTSEGVVLGTTVDRFFLPSVTELFGITNSGLNEGTKMTVFDNTDFEPIYPIWTRSADLATENQVFHYRLNDEEVPALQSTVGTRTSARTLMVCVIA